MEMKALGLIALSRVEVWTEWPWERGLLSPCSRSPPYFHRPRINGEPSSLSAASLWWQPAQMCLKPGARFWSKDELKTGCYLGRGEREMAKLKRVFLQNLSSFCLGRRTCTYRLPPIVVSLLQTTPRSLVVGVNCRLI